MCAKDISGADKICAKDISGADRIYAQRIFQELIEYVQRIFQELIVYVQRIFPELIEYVCKGHGLIWQWAAGKYVWMTRPAICYCSTMELARASLYLILSSTYIPHLYFAMQIPIHPYIFWKPFWAFHGIILINKCICAEQCKSEMGNFHMLENETAGKFLLEQFSLTWEIEWLEKFSNLRFEQI